MQLVKGLEIVEIRGGPARLAGADAVLCSGGEADPAGELYSMRFFQIKLISSPTVHSRIVFLRKLTAKTHGAPEVKNITR